MSISLTLSDEILYKSFNDMIKENIMEMPNLWVAGGLVATSVLSGVVLMMCAEHLKTGTGRTLLSVAGLLVLLGALGVGLALGESWAPMFR